MSLVQIANEESFFYFWFGFLYAFISLHEKWINHLSRDNFFLSRTRFTLKSYYETNKNHFRKHEKLFQKKFFIKFNRPDRHLVRDK